MKMALLTKPRLFTLLVVGACTLAYGGAAKLRGKFEVCVQDNDGQPMVGIPVVCEFENPPTDWSEKRSDECYLEKTDARGRCSFKGRTLTGSVGCGIDMRGFYRAFREIPIKEVTKGGVLVPEYQVTTIVVQRVVHPIPLFVKEAKSVRPDGFGTGTNTVSFDMLKGDWLPPRGTGEVADVSFTRLPRKSYGRIMRHDESSAESYEEALRVEFPGKGNGIMEVMPLPGSDLKVRCAPEEGYVSSYEERRGRDRNLQDYNTTESLDKSQCFRIRTQYDEDGRIIAANYGKIYKGVKFWKANNRSETDPCTDRVRFLYYVNPTPGDRNLEFDGKTNLSVEARDPDEFDW